MALPLRVKDIILTWSPLGSPIRHVHATILGNYCDHIQVSDTRLVKVRLHGHVTRRPLLQLPSSHPRTRHELQPTGHFIYKVLGNEYVLVFLSKWIYRIITLDLIKSINTFRLFSINYFPVSYLFQQYQPPCVWRISHDVKWLPIFYNIFEYYVLDKKRAAQLNAPRDPTVWWRHQMETFSSLLALCEGNPPVTGRFSPTKASDA